MERIDYQLLGLSPAQQELATYIDTTAVLPSDETRLIREGYTIIGQGIFANTRIMQTGEHTSSRVELGNLFFELAIIDAEEETKGRATLDIKRQQATVTTLSGREHSTGIGSNYYDAEIGALLVRYNIGSRDYGLSRTATRRRRNLRSIQDSEDTFQR